MTIKAEKKAKTPMTKAKAAKRAKAFTLGFC